MVLPGFDQLRVPARFWSLAVLCLCVAMGVLAAAALRLIPPRIVPVVVAVAAIGLTLDGWAPVSGVGLVPAAPRPDLIRGGLVLTLPLGAHLDRDAGAQLEAVEGEWVAVNGHSGYDLRHYQLLREASRRADPALLSPFLARGDLHVVLFESWPEQDALVELQPGARLVGRGNGLRQYLIPQQGTRARIAPGGERRRIAAVSVSCADFMRHLTLDGDNATRWHCGPQQPGQALTADLGAVMTVGDVVPALGEYSIEFPKQLVVDTSLDGATWSEAWNRGVLPEAFEALVIDPGAARIVLSFEPRPARYVRLRITSQDDTQPWSIAELEIWSGT
jgi:hypothetical protein